MGRGKWLYTYIWHLLDLGLTLTENGMPKARDNGKEYNKASGEHN